jgi:hypothetical protein
VDNIFLSSVVHRPVTAAHRVSTVRPQAGAPVYLGHLDLPTASTALMKKMTDIY